MLPEVPSSGHKERCRYDPIVMDGQKAAVGPTACPSNRWARFNAAVTAGQRWRPPCKEDPVDPILEEMIWRLSDIVVGRPTQAEATKVGGAHKARLDRIAARGQSAVWPFADSINAAMLRQYEQGHASLGSDQREQLAADVMIRIARVMTQGTQRDT